MNNKNLIITIIVVIVVVLGGIYLYNTMKTPGSSYNSNGYNNSSNVKGTMYVTVTDAAADMQNVTAVNMTIDKVDAYSNTQGWVTLSQNSQTVNLLDLKAKSQAELLAKIDVPADTYSQIRLHVAKVWVTEFGQVKEAKMPSGELKIMANTMVKGNGNAVASFDIMADKSMHKTGNGEFIFAPVVKFDSTSNANVNVSSDDKVVVQGGTVNSSVNVGMDIDGTIKSNFQLDSNTKLKINGGAIQINTGY